MSGNRKGGSSVQSGKGRARRESSAGGVVFRMVDVRGGEATRKTQPEPPPLFLLIRDTYDKWGFPKGHVERGERAEVTARREVMEETGLRRVTIVGAIAKIEWFFRLHGELIHKTCQYFLMESAVAETHPQKSEGISECRWASVDEARELIAYENARAVLQRAYEMVMAQTNTSAVVTG